MASTPDITPSRPMLPDRFVIYDRHQETADTFTWSLEPVGARRPFLFSPGQFNMLYAFGVGEVPISISGHPDHTGRLIHTIRDVGGVTHAMERLGAGEMVGVRGPFGTAWPVHAAEGDDIVFIAGGIGLAPLRPAIEHVLSRRERYGRVSLLYGARNPDQLLYLKQLQAWRSRLDIEVEITVDIAAPGWHGMVGVVTHLIPFAPFDPASTTAMICGPEIMMRFCARALEDRGVDGEHIFVSIERNMKCAVALCGHCQWGPHFVCKDGPVFSHAKIAPLLRVREL